VVVVAKWVSIIIWVGKSRWLGETPFLALPICSSQRLLVILGHSKQGELAMCVGFRRKGGRYKSREEKGVAARQLIDGFAREGRGKVRWRAERIIR
jgi:hypothetical protein